MSNETFYDRLDRIERENRIKRIFADRPENLHDYQGCDNDLSRQNAAESLPAQPEPLMPCLNAGCGKELSHDGDCDYERFDQVALVEVNSPEIPDSSTVEAKEKERYEASDEYIRGFERCKELAERIVDEHLGYLDRIGHLDPVTSVAEPKPTPSTPADIGCEGCDEPVYLTRDYGYSHCDTTLNVGCDARPKTNHPSVPKPQPESSSISSEHHIVDAHEMVDMIDKTLSCTSGLSYGDCLEEIKRRLEAKDGRTNG